MRIITTTFIAFFVTASLAAQTPASWPQWRGPARDGVASGFTVPATWPTQLTRKWQAKVGAGHSSPVVSGNRVILHSRIENREVVAAYDLDSGKQLWQDGIAAPYTMNPAAMGHGPGPKSTPAIAGGRVFSFGISGIFSAHDLATGKLLWRKNAPPREPEFGTATSPLVDGNVVIAFLGGTGAGALTAMDVATGTERWRWTGDGPAYSSPIIATFAGTRQIIVQSQTKLVGVNAADGRLLWEVPVKTAYEQNSVTPVVVGDLLIYAGLDLPTMGAAVTAGPDKRSSLTQKWEHKGISMYMSTPTAVGTTIYGLSHKSRGQFFAINAASGKELWMTKGREAENASIVRAGNYLLLATTNGELIVVRADPAKYDEVKRYTVTDSAMWAHPAFAGRTIIVKDVDTLTAWTF